MASRSSSEHSGVDQQGRPIKSRKVIFLGDQSVGKTSIITRFLYGAFDTHYQATIGIDFVAKVVTLDDGRSVKLQLWDTAGQERFRSLIPAYLRDTAACAVVFDLTSKESFMHVRSWVDQVRDERGADAGVTIVLVGNKADLKDSRQVSSEEAQSLADELGIKYFETSAKSGVDIDRIFTEIAKSMPDESEESNNEEAEAVQVTVENGESNGGKKSNNGEVNPASAELLFLLFFGSFFMIMKMFRYLSAQRFCVVGPKILFSIMADIAGVKGKPNEELGTASSARHSSGRVPHYNTDGHQHHRFPTKSLGVYSDVAPVDDWEKAPKYRTRSEMLHQRRANLVPDISYDVDGDGVVGTRDYFISKHFDDDRDGKLNQKERQRFSFGHDQAGSKRPFAVQQRRGKIITQDSTFELGETYPAHPISKVIPSHNTKTELELDRKVEMKNAAAKLFNEWERSHPAMVSEKPPSKDYYVDQPRITHIGERAAADHEASRVCAGLMPINTHINPDRESKAIGVKWVDEPEVKTRSQLLEHRREKLKHDLDECRNKGEAEFVPLSVRAITKEAAAHEYRKGDGVESKTKTLLDLQRRRDRIEHNLANCRREPRKMPAFSEKDEPWWVLQRGTAGDVPNNPCRSKSIKSRVAEVTFKVTDPPPEPFATNARRETKIETDRRPPIIGDVKPKSRKPLFPDGQSKTIKRWTADIIEHGALRNGKRLFDTLRPCQVYAKDFAPLEVWSSFDVIRHDALKKQALARSDRTPTLSKLSSTALANSTQLSSDAPGVTVSGLEDGSSEIRRASVMSFGSRHPKEDTSSSTLSRRPSIASPAVEGRRHPGPSIIDRISKSGPKTSAPCSEIRTSGFERLGVDHLHHKEAMKLFLSHMINSASRRTLLGLAVMALVVITFVASGAAIQLIFTSGDYDKPVALTVYSLTLSVLLLGCRKFIHMPGQDTLPPTESSPLLASASASAVVPLEEAKWPQRRLVWALGAMWFVSQLSYNISLKYTSVATNSSLSSCSSVFTFIFSILLLGYPLCRAAPISAVLMCVIGVLITALNRPSPKTDLAVPESILGDSLALGSACCYGLFTCCLKLWVPDERMVAYVFGMFGVVAFVLGIPLLLVCHITGLETLMLPTWGQFGAMTANAILGSVASDYLLSVAVILLSPLAAAVGLSLTIPLSLVVDSSILGLHTFKGVYVLGSALVFGAVVLISWDTYNVESDKAKVVTSPPSSPQTVRQEQKHQQGAPLIIGKANAEVTEESSVNV
ncbi:hypothetical protein FOL47_006942 [Perkinsus chesapeaki]|uniref:Uncharacterized protein n=1 Tax=Perkinsus chesapeaki TaxID=330153 RepID=A0A7J6N2D9_PERCH|nr:hypothetical protein FOL47_006942 [Perkinsus chesapeaki]